MPSPFLTSMNRDRLYFSAIFLGLVLFVAALLFVAPHKAKVDWIVSEGYYPSNVSGDNSKYFATDDGSKINAAHGSNDSRLAFSRTQPSPPHINAPNREAGDSYDNIKSDPQNVPEAQKTDGILGAESSPEIFPAPVNSVDTKMNSQDLHDSHSGSDIVALRMSDTPRSPGGIKFPPTQTTPPLAEPPKGSRIPTSPAYISGQPSPNASHKEKPLFRTTEEGKGSLPPPSQHSALIQQPNSRPEESISPPLSPLTQKSDQKPLEQASPALRQPRNKPDEKQHDTQRQSKTKEKPLNSSAGNSGVSKKLPIPEWAAQHFSEDAKNYGKRKELDKSCNLFNGKWIYDESYPLWDPTFKMEKNDFLCLQYGRNDTNYLKLRWQPGSCNMPRFNASYILERMRNRRIGFFGDSLAKNQFFSLAGMLTVGTKPGLVKQGRTELFPDYRRVLLAFHFVEFNVSLELYTSGYLVNEVRNPANLAGKVEALLQMDRMSEGLEKAFSGIDLAVFNAGHWFSSTKLSGRKCFPEVNGAVNYEMSPEEVFKMAVENWSKWLESHQRKDQTVIFRSYEPFHGRGGPRACPSKVAIWSAKEPTIDPKVAIASRIFKAMKRPPLFLDITELSSFRNDGHITYTKQPSDCSHWCTPGVPDTWNELLFAMMMQTRRPPFDVGPAIPHSIVEQPMPKFPVSNELKGSIMGKKKNNNSSVEEEPVLIESKQEKDGSPSQKQQRSENSHQTNPSETKPASSVPNWAVSHFAEDPKLRLSRKAMDESCDLFNGRWVYDESYPLWDPRLKMPTNDFLCLQHGRNDASYMKLRWQPSQCNMPRFNASFVLDKLRNRRIAFIGDSLAKNQFFSLAGMLSKGAKPGSMQQGGREIFHNARRVMFAFLFTDFNVSLELYTSGYLVNEVRDPRDLVGKVKYLLEMDKVGEEFDKIVKGVDVAVFNSGHWFNRVKLRGRKCFPKVNGSVDYEMQPVEVFKAAIGRWSKWLDTKWSKEKTFFFRSFEPVHGKGTRPRVCPSKLPVWAEKLPGTEPKVKLAWDIIQKMKHPALFLDITNLSALRNDGHTHIDSPKHGDCSHWCTPGVPDTWNELMFAMMIQLKRPPFDG